jgi:tRNA(fMet)-specific endonuclease VapC
MSFLLDTDICSAFLKGDRKVANRFIQYGGRLHVSTVTVGELFSGLLRARSSPRLLADLFDMLKNQTILDVTYDVAYQFGITRTRFWTGDSRPPAWT